MAAFFRRYVGGEGAFEPYLTGELAAEGKPSDPAVGLPDQPDAGKRIPCIDRVADSYFGAAGRTARRDPSRHREPAALSALGDEDRGSSGFANPYLTAAASRRSRRRRRAGSTGATRSRSSSNPRSSGSPGTPDRGQAPARCPRPGGRHRRARRGGPARKRPGQPLLRAPAGARLGDPVAGHGTPAKLGTTIPAADRTSAASRPAWRPRQLLRPAQSGAWRRRPVEPGTDGTAGLHDRGDRRARATKATVEAADPALRQRPAPDHWRRPRPAGPRDARDIRVPLADFADQGVDLTELREAGAPLRRSRACRRAARSSSPTCASRSRSTGTDVLLDSTAPNAGPGEGPPTSGPNPVDRNGRGVYKRADARPRTPGRDARTPGANVWTVDDDGVQCPNAEFTTSRQRSTYASPWDTIVVCAGHSTRSPRPRSTANSTRSQTGAMNGLTINKPLKINGAGADKVTIKPADERSAPTLAGTEPYLRDGGGNVITVSRQSLGSTEYDEMFVDISGVTIESAERLRRGGRRLLQRRGPDLRQRRRAAETARRRGRTDDQTAWLGRRRDQLPDRRRPRRRRTQVTIDDSKSSATSRAASCSTTPAAPTPPRRPRRTVRDEAGRLRQRHAGRRHRARTPLIPQTGIQYHAGADRCSSTGSKITGNLSPTEQRKSVGVLLTGAETLTNWFSISGSLIIGNGYGLFNADIKNDSRRGSGPGCRRQQLLGHRRHPGHRSHQQLGPARRRGHLRQRRRTGRTASVVFSTGRSARHRPHRGRRHPADAAPVGSIVNPGDGEAVEAGVAIEPVVLAEDDYGVKSVSLTADGAPVATRERSPRTCSTGHRARPRSARR